MSQQEAGVRKASVSRETLETQITVELCLDGTGECTLDTGLPFLEHMLDQIARHGQVDLNIVAKGDLHIDAHHTVEDIGITLGQAFSKAIGDKKGIVRYGHAYVPLDEALSRVWSWTAVVARVWSFTCPSPAQRWASLMSIFSLNFFRAL